MASPSLCLAGTTHCRGGDPTNLVLIVADSQCTGYCTEKGTIQAVVCEGWGPATLIPPNVILQRDTQRGRKKGEKKERRGGKTAPEEDYNTGKEKRGWMEIGGKRQWRNRFAPFCWSAFFTPVDNPSIPFPSMILSVIWLFIHHFINVYGCSAYFILHLLFLGLFLPI